MALSLTPAAVVSLARTAAALPRGLMGAVATRSAVQLNSDAAATPKRAYLVWEQGFAMQFFGSLALLMGATFAAQRSTTAWLYGMAVQQRLIFALQTYAHRLEMWSILGLLSSSCCALQLLLNAFSLGCAGFNTLLGPLRPYLLAATVFLQACVWRATFTGIGPNLFASAIGGTTLCAALALMPEALQLCLRARSGVDKGGLARVDTVRVSVGGMGCTACTVKVQSALEGVEGVAGVAVSLDEASATLVLSGAAEAGGREVVKQRARAAIAAAGFDVDDAVAIEHSGSS